VIRAAGDAAVVLELGRQMDVAVNRCALAAAADLSALRLPGVRDVVPAFASVTVHFDPGTADLGLITAALEAAAPNSASSGPAAHLADGLPQGRLVEVPVAYGGTDGPDLDDVAAASGLSATEVLRRHAAATYRVFMLGFAPGFPYLGAVDPAIAMVRHAAPRGRVAAGSVGIADAQTGIYPTDSPGGWRVIGRTDLALFDADRDEPAALRPGDAVRFVPVDRVGPVPVRTPAPPTAPARALTVLRPGWQTTVQDLGRWGCQHLGVPVSGAMDTLAHRSANRLVGNPDGAATLEVTVVGPELRFEADVWVALCGADLDATLDGRSLPLGIPVQAREGSVLRFGSRAAGTRAYLACAGGVAVPPVLGSRSTCLPGRLGGFAGRALRAGDRVPLGTAEREGTVGATGRPWEPTPTGPVTRLRVLPGPDAHALETSALERLAAGPFRVSAQANRMGYRLEGTIADAGAAPRMLSTGTVPGGVQITGDGVPIVLTADRQTSGGYPQIAAVIAADLPRLGQAGPGDWLTFAWCTPGEAQAALRAQEQWRVDG